MRVDADLVRARRRAQREERLERAHKVVATLAERIDLVAAVVVGSTARGDIADTSDVDVLVIAGDLPDDFRDRGSLVDVGVPGVDVIAWTVTEWHRRRGRNPLAAEAVREGVVIHGALPAEPEP